MAIKEALKNSIDINEAFKGSSLYKKSYRDIDFDKLVPRDRRTNSLVPGYMQYLGAGPFGTELTDKMLMMNEVLGPDAKLKENERDNIKSFSSFKV